MATNLPDLLPIPDRAQHESPVTDVVFHTECISWFPRTERFSLWLLKFEVAGGVFVGEEEGGLGEEEKVEKTLVGGGGVGVGNIHSPFYI